MTLPRLRPPGLFQLVFFELSRGFPEALAVLRGHLTGRQLASTLLFLARRNFSNPPFRVVPDWPANPDKLSIRQFRSALVLDEVLRKDLCLPDEEAKRILEEVISRVGARFIEANTPPGTHDAWPVAGDDERERFMREMGGRFFNAKVEIRSVSAEEARFDVVRCRFVELAREAGLPYLAPMFCKADSLYYGRPSTPELIRQGTIAEGAGHCDFRFVYRSGQV